MTDILATLPDFDDVDDWFLSLGSEASPAELHGQLCGLLAGGHVPQPNEWLAQCATLMEVELLAGTPTAEGIGALVGITIDQFTAGFDLELLIPESDAPLADRLEALAVWSQGFLTGFALAGNTQESWRQLSEESREVLTDLTSVAQIDSAGEEGEPEGTEEDFLEVAEYVRLGAVQVWLDLNPPQPGASSSVDEETSDDVPPVLH
ncbi:MAG: UPF0149 family protein [Pseudomonadales bacterium]